MKIELTHLTRFEGWETLGVYSSRIMVPSNAGNMIRRMINLLFKFPEYKHIRFQCDKEEYTVTISP